MIILISGQIGSGKDTFCELFRKHSKIQWENKKFAFKLKQIVALLTGCKVEDLENEEFKNQYLPEEFDLETWVSLNNEAKSRKITKYTYRELLQKLGTDLLRDKFHPQVHINALYADYKIISGSFSQDFDGYSGDAVPVTLPDRYPNWMITDLRFQNEFESADKYKGITIRVERSMTCSQWIQSKYFKDIAFTSAGYDFLVNNNEVITKSSLLNLISLSSEKYLKHPKTDKNWLKLIHQSETDLNYFAENKKFDFLIDNDSTLEAFEEKVKDLVYIIERGRY